MSNRDISFSEFTPHVQTLLTQALNAALTMVEELPTTFCLYNNNDMPTKAEARHATEVIRTTLNNRKIFYGAEDLIAGTLRFICFDIENWVNGRDEAQDVAAAQAEYTKNNGINVDDNTIIELSCLARNLSPHTEIYSTRVINDTTVYSDFAKAFIKQLLNAQNQNNVMYGQFNVGIVVDGVMFDFPIEHELVQHIASDIRKAAVGI